MQASNWCDRPSRLIKSPSASLSSKTHHHPQTFSSAAIRQGKTLFSNQATNVGSSRLIEQINQIQIRANPVKSGIGTTSSSGLAAACMNNTNNAPMASPPSSTKPLANQGLTKSRSLTNESDTRDTSNSMTPPNKAPVTNNTMQKSPSDSLGSKNGTEKARKSRNKEGTNKLRWHLD